MKYGLILSFLCFTLPVLAGVSGDLRKSGKLYSQKKYGQALEKYNDVLKNSPNNEQASFGAGASAYYLKDYKTAAQSFEQVTKQNGLRTQDALFNLGNTHYRAGQKEQAIAAYRQAILKNPQDKEAIHNLQILLQEENNSNNQNNQNNNNSQNSSPNQQQGDQDNPAGNNNEQNDNQQQTPENQDSAQKQAEKDAAERVMQMARENEQKPSQQMKAPQLVSVEEDW